jgi:hypothetical protein
LNCRRFLDIFLEIGQDLVMAATSQRRALQNYRQRLHKRGMARFEVLAPDSDRKLIRALAKRLARNDSEAAHIRQSVEHTLAENSRGKGGILAALRRSPLVGADLHLQRSRDPGRDFEL